ncbi:hypothetical protein E4582_03130 [Luteimonas yindakuii]|uniref:Uncharacterized protein n=1 Tax=Luteimonas yindakuii TaxID=2565782 RepID=A0A4Z1R2I1_9GAMM|nr:hypothetical protein [Luteimonas yindakuii]TKS53864.1 hypothetical protein E4582_03130 [Luteimonas yindakuii]
MFDEDLGRLEALGQMPHGSAIEDMATLVAAVRQERARHDALMCMIIAPDEGETEFPEERTDEGHDDGSREPADRDDRARE